MDTSTSTDRTNVTPQGYTFGGVNYKTETRTNDRGEQYSVDIAQPQIVTPAAAPVSTPPVVQKPTSSTVLSNANVIENTIPTNNSKLDALSTKGTTIGADGMERYSDGNLVTKTVQSPAGNTYTLDNNGQIVAGPTDGDYTVGENISTYKPTDTTTPDDDYAKEMDLLDQMKTTLDANSKAAIDNIQQKYEIRKQQQEDINKRQEAGVNSSLLLDSTGSSRYAQISSGSIISTEERYGIQQLQELDSEENDALTAARTAQSNGDFQIMEKQLNLADEKRKEKLDAATKLNDTIAATNKKLKDQAIQSTRDSAIANLVGQGVTDPATLLDYLNKDNDGNVVGDFTADEISNTLKNIAKVNGFGGDTDKLSSNLRDYFILKQNNTLPSSITSLPEGDQLKAWLNYIKPTKGSAGVKAVNKLTLAEARTQGLPLSTVGMSEQEIADSFASDTPPDWFIEKAQSEKQQSLTPEVIQPLWDEYRDSYQKSRGKADTVSSYDKDVSNNKEKATNYFKSTYGDQVDDDTVTALTDQVQMYIDSGMTYAKAMEQVIKDASE